MTTSPRDVWCASCGADAGQPCVRMRGDKTKPRRSRELCDGKYHQPRRNDAAALDRGERR